jgi:hypothetical protein
MIHADMQKTLPFLCLSLLFLCGCQGVSNASQPEKTAVSIMKFAPYSFSDMRNKHSEESVQEQPDMRDFYAGSWVKAYGTWNSRTTLGFPNHSVEISCLRIGGMEPYAHDGAFHSEGLCIEATALMDTERNMLLAKTEFYDISKWDFDEVVAVGAEDTSQCYKKELKFDRKNQTVTLLRTTVPGSDAAKCLIEPDAEPLLMHLGCPPMPWPTKSETHDVNGESYTQYCLPDFDKMSNAQRETFTEAL